MCGKITNLKLQVHSDNALQRVQNCLSQLNCCSDDDVTCLQFHTIPGDQDYDELSAVSLYFTAGTLVGSSDCATIFITNDDILECDEFFTFSLNSSDPINFDVSLGTVLILEDTDCEFVRFTTYVD